MVRIGATLVAALMAMLSAVPAVSEIVPWQEARDHVGQVVTIEGDVAAAETTSEGCILRFATDDPQALRVILLVPLFSSLPREPDRLFRGKRVRVSGRVQRFGEQPEMLVRDPGQIEIVDVAASLATPLARPATVPPPPPPPPSTTTPPPEAQAVEPPVPTAAEAVPPPVPDPPPAAIPLPAPLRADPCPPARAKWEEAAAVLRTRASILDRCLVAARYRCRAEAAALAPALATLEAAEQAVEAACP